MAAYGIYGQTAPTAQPKPKATDVFTSTNPIGATATAQGAQPNQANSITGAPAPSPFALPGGQRAPLNPFGPVAPAANPGSFQALMDGSAPARQQNIAGSQQAISDMLMPSQAPSRESETARSSFIKAQTESQRQGAEQSALSGRIQTGQAGGDAQSIRDQGLGQRRDLENSLAIADGQRNDQNRQAGLSALLGYESLGEQSRTSQAQMGQQERQIAESARQFDTRQEFETWATREGYSQDAIARGWQAEEAGKERTSREGVAFAGLSLDEKRMAQEGSQFASKLDFDKWALGKNLDNETATRLWQSIENEKEITSAEKVAFAGLTLKEKEMAQQGNQFDKKLDFDTWAKGQDVTDAERDRAWKSIESQKGRVFTSAESALDRTLNESQFAETIGLSKEQFGEQIRQFGSKQDFDRWATKAGLDAQAAELVWKSSESDIGRKWETGERLSTQDHQVNITRLQGEVDKDKASFSQLLGLKTMEAQAEIDKLTASTANDYTAARDTRAMSHDQAMEELKGSITAKLEAAGYDNATAMQAAEIHANSVQKDQDRAMATLEAKAELAFKYNALASEEGISREQIAARRDEVAGQLSLGLQELGLDTKKFEATIKDQEFQDRMGMLSTMIELGGSNPDVADKASISLLSMLKEKGMITPEQYTAGVAGIGRPAPKPSDGPMAVPGGGPFAALGIAAESTGGAVAAGGRAIGGAVADAGRATKRLLRNINPF